MLSTTVITICGIEIDSVAMESRLPVERLERLSIVTWLYMQSKKDFIRDHQSLIGLLNFACLVVSSGSAFFWDVSLILLVMWKSHIISLNLQHRLERLFEHGKSLSKMLLAKLLSYTICWKVQWCLRFYKLCCCPGFKTVCIYM